MSQPPFWKPTNNKLSGDFMTLESKLSKIQETDHPANHSQTLFDPNNLLHTGAIHVNNLISVSDDEDEDREDEVSQPLHRE